MFYVMFYFFQYEHFSAKRAISFRIKWMPNFLDVSGVTNHYLLTFDAYLADTWSYLNSENLLGSL